MLLRIFAPVGLIIAVVAGGCGSASPEDEVREAVSGFTKAADEHDAGTYCELLAQRWREEVVDSYGAADQGPGACAKLIGMRMKAERKRPKAGWKVVAVRVREARAAATVERREARVTERLGYQLVREAGTWRIARAGQVRTPDGRRVYRVPSGSMQPTLKYGQLALVDDRAYRDAEPAVGDVVAFHPPNGAVFDDERSCRDPGVSAPPRTELCVHPTPGQSEETFIKRIVAGPGDRVALRRGHVLRNGRRVADDAITPCEPVSGVCDFPRPITVPKGMYYMIGDNRGNSSDSRFWGAVPAGWIVGKVAAA